MYKKTYLCMCLKCPFKHLFYVKSYRYVYFPEILHTFVYTHVYVLNKM